MTSWADDVPEPAPRSGGRRGPPATEAPRRSVLDRLGPAAAPVPSSSSSIPAPRAHALPQPRAAEARGRGGAAGNAPDFGTEVDWRLSRISLDDDDAPKHGSRRARGSPAEAAPRRIVTVTPPASAASDAVTIPARLAGRIVLPTAAPQVASPPSRRTPPPLPRDAAAAAPPAKALAGAAPFVVRVSPQGERVVQRAAVPPAAAPSPPAKPAAPKPAPRAGDLPAPRAAAPGWLFRDPRGTVQGPHSAGELIAWYGAGYYGADLPVQRVGAETWTTLRAALPELKEAASAAAPKALAASPAGDMAGAAPAAPPVPKGEPAPEALGEPAQQAAQQADGASATAASVWSTEETAAAKRMFDKLGTLWMYIDPSGERQGPFGGHDMATWFLGGYMEDRELKVASATAREPGDADFAPLAVLLRPKQADDVLHAASP